MPFYFPIDLVKYTKTHCFTVPFRLHYQEQALTKIMMTKRHLLPLIPFCLAALAQLANGFSDWDRVVQYRRNVAHRFANSQRPATATATATIMATGSDSTSYIQSEIIYVSSRGDIAGHMVGSTSFSTKIMNIQK